MYYDKSLLKKKYSESILRCIFFGGVHASTIFRELSRNKMSKGRYNYKLAESFVQERKTSKRISKKFTEYVKIFVDRKIKKSRSPELRAIVVRMILVWYVLKGYIMISKTGGYCGLI